MVTYCQPRREQVTLLVERYVRSETPASSSSISKQVCDKECPSPLGGLHQLEVACLADRKIARPGSMGSNGSPFWVHPWFATGRRRRPVHGRSPSKLTEPPPDALGL